MFYGLVLKAALAQKEIEKCGRDNPMFHFLRQEAP